VEPKYVRESATYLSMITLPDDANPAGNVHGGVIMKQIDNCAGVTAARHARTNVVTASIDRIDFHKPCYVGDVLTLRASINYVGKTSMEIGCRVEAENIISGETRHIASAYLTYVALKDGKPTQVPGIVPETEDEKRRLKEAKERRENRLRECEKS